MVRKMSSSVGSAPDGVVRLLKAVEKMVRRVEIGRVGGIRSNSAVAVLAVTAGTFGLVNGLAAAFAKRQRLVGRRTARRRPGLPGAPIADGGSDLLHVRLDAHHFFRRNRTVVVHVDDAVAMTAVRVYRPGIQFREIRGLLPDGIQFGFRDTSIVVLVVGLDERGDRAIMLRVLGEQP